MGNARLSDERVDHSDQASHCFALSRRLLSYRLINLSAAGMADKLTRKARSENLRRIRRRDTSLELVVRRCLHRVGSRYLFYKKGLTGYLPKHEDAGGPPHHAPRTDRYDAKLHFGGTNTRNASAPTRKGKL